MHKVVRKYIYYKTMQKLCHIILPCSETAGYILDFWLMRSVKLNQIFGIVCFKCQQAVISSQYKLAQKINIKVIFKRARCRHRMALLVRKQDERPAAPLTNEHQTTGVIE